MLSKAPAADPSRRANQAFTKSPRFRSVVADAPARRERVRAIRLVVRVAVAARCPVRGPAARGIVAQPVETIVRPVAVGVIDTSRRVSGSATVLSTTGRRTTWGRTTSRRTTCAGRLRRGRQQGHDTRRTSRNSYHSVEHCVCGASEESASFYAPRQDGHSWRRFGFAQLLHLLSNNKR